MDNMRGNACTYGPILKEDVTSEFVQVSIVNHDQVTVSGRACPMYGAQYYIHHVRLELVLKLNPMG
jgi:hypothetical protein